MLWRLVAVYLVGLVILFAGLLLLQRPAMPRELYSGQYDQVDPKIQKWFREQKSPRTGELCCNVADGIYAEEVIRGTHYWARWRVNGEMIDWQQVPEDTVIHAPNPNGSAVVWYLFKDGEPVIRCFVPGGGV